MIALLLLCACVFAEYCEIPNLKNGEILCNVCKNIIGILDKLDGHRVKEYLDNLCEKANGFIATVCTKIANFGIDKLVELLHNKVEPETICVNMNLC